MKRMIQWMMVTLALVGMAACGDTNVAGTQECTPGQTRCADDNDRNIQICSDSGVFGYHDQCPLDEKCSKEKDVPAVCVPKTTPDPCDPSPCHANATCAATADSFTCTCNAGYSGDGLNCADDDECAADPGPCHANATCLNTDGSFACQCNAGYSGDQVSCTDDDECALETDNCHENAVCTNTDGSFTCACTNGFVGDGIVCQEASECTTDEECDSTDPCTTYTCDANECVPSSIENCCVDPDDCSSTDPCTSFECAENNCLPSSIADCCDFGNEGKVTCDDGHACTIDTCTPQNQCDNTPTDDGPGCCASTDPPCNDNNPCTNDGCEMVSNTCSHSSKIDGASCGTNKVCKEGQCETKAIDPKTPAPGAPSS